MTDTRPFWMEDGLTEDVCGIAYDNLSYSRSLFAHAMRNGGTYCSDWLPRKHGSLKCDAATLIADMESIGGRFAVRASSGDHAYGFVWPDAYVKVDHDGEDPPVFSTATLIASTRARFDAIREVIANHVVESTPETVTAVTMLTGTAMAGYHLSTIGKERQTLTRDNYTAAVMAKYDHALAQLTAKEPAGRMLLLDGPAGTGKTRLVRAMIATLKDAARVVVVPSHLIADLSGPNLIGSLVGHTKPTVIVLEDADFALLSRDNVSQFEKEGSTSALSAMLNLSDGIIGGMIDLRIIATTNAELEAIDPALLRPGRLIDRISIGKLTPAEAARVIERESGKPWGGDTPMTLAEAYDAAGKAKAV